MPDLVRGSKAFYGQAIGIMLLDTNFPRIPGDIGNATTFDFPVRYSVVKGATAIRVVEMADRSLKDSFIRAGRELEEEGVRAITTSCGYLIMFQDELAQALKIPIFTSSLLQVPVVHKMLGSDSRIGILTANDTTIGQHLKKAGITDTPIAVKGAQNEPDFYNVFVENSQELDVDKAEQAVVRMAKELVSKYPDVGAFVCEGSNFSSFGPAVQEATKLPFFDIVTLTQWVYTAVVRKRVQFGFI